MCVPGHTSRYNFLTQGRGQELETSHRDRAAGRDRPGALGCLCHKHPPLILSRVARPRTRLHPGPPDPAFPAPAPSLPARAWGSRLMCSDVVPSVSHVPSLRKDSAAGRRLSDPANWCVGQTTSPKEFPRARHFLAQHPTLQRPRCHTLGLEGGTEPHLKTGRAHEGFCGFLLEI